MPLKLMYITCNPEIARIAESVGVDRIFVDMEYIGKAERQPGDTVKSSHTIDDVKRIRSTISTSELLVRCNPYTVNESFNSECEIEQIIEAGADIIMLPMAKDVETVSRFCDAVGGRAKTMLLLETAEGVGQLDAILKSCPIDELHIGLNDLHIAYNKKFMFELLTDGTVENIIEKMRPYSIPYGFGGIARIGKGILPSERVITEHYRLGSNAAILSRAFCNIKDITSLSEISEIFAEGVANIRKFESIVATYSWQQYEKNHLETIEIVRKIVSEWGE